MTGAILLILAFGLLFAKRDGALARGLAGMGIAALCLAAGGGGPDATDAAFPAASALIALLAFATGSTPATYAAIVIVSAIASAAAEARGIAFGSAPWLGAATIALIATALTARAPRRVISGGGAAALIGALGVCLGGAPLGTALALAGMGALAGLAPMHRWSLVSPRVPALLAVVAHACALVALRHSAGSGAPLLALGAMATALGSADVWLAGDDAKRVRAAAAMQRGAAAVAFGIGDPVADGIGFLHLLVVSVSQMAAILDADRPFVRAALAGLPPSGVFAGVAGIVFVVARPQPVLAALVAASALAGGAGLLRGVDGTRMWPTVRSMPALALIALAAVIGFVPPSVLFGR